MIVNLLVLSAVTFQRLSELLISKRNMRQLLASGAREFAPGHYSLIIAVHIAWLAGLWWLAPNRPASFTWLGFFAVLCVARVWVMASLGPRWTARIIVIQGPLVKSGPYRFFAHPNYMLVIAETLVLPLAFGLLGFALTFVPLVGATLAIRIRHENEALRFATKYL